MQRANTDDEFLKDYYKLMNNSVFGRTMMNTRNFRDLKIISDEKYVSKPNFDRATIFTENLVAVYMKKTEVKLNKPIYLGMCILDMSKVRMYDFYYNTLKKTYGKNIRLLYTDTDSLIVEITTEDFYTDVKNNEQLLNEFDFSEYPENNKYGLPRINKKVPGKFKDEFNGKILSEFFGLRSKLYAFKLFENEHEVKRAKGVKKPIVKNELCFDDFYECLITRDPKYVKQNTFRTENHEISTVKQKKKALSAYDDKRYILENGIDTVAWGNFSTKIEREKFREYLDNLIRTNNKKE
ncbi:DNA polymerase, palm domain,DNA-directed DNA polymerase, family B, conserved site [Cinara cedri]|uniref:DNA polymerase, palm domain,DNA-directed DNA polymerase, family B, conserved site n=1 Tax=Cinara cedri TaxID=506608 RepID=A0A5E4MFI5_9HEMI|nr:DNA polymerase, palm domain,DNA-directed DNA polymerase, family B, conserved site [Cinara cedri]